MKRSGIYLYYFGNIQDDYKSSYVGSTINFKERHKFHIDELKKKIHRNSRFQRAFNKYGEENLKYKELEEMTFPESYDKLTVRDFLESREFYWFEKIGCRYNIAIPGFSSRKHTKKEKSELFKSKKKVVYMVDDNLNIIREYSSGKEAADDIKGSPICISRVCRLKEAHIKGYLFRFKETLDKKYIPPDRKKIWRIALGKPVICYNSNADYLQEYDSIAHAAEILKIDEDGIRKCCTQRGFVTKGYLFKFKNDQRIIKPIKINPKRGVAVLEYKNGILIKEHKCIKQASLSTRLDKDFIRRRCLKEPQCKHMEYSFEYKV